MRSGNFSDLQMQALPLPGIRTFDFLALLLPGVTESPRAVGDTVGPGIGTGIGTVGQYSVNGMRSRANNFMLDGSDNNDQDVAARRQGYLSLLPQSVESVQELQVATLLWDAELGRNLGAQVNAVSKGGSYTVHGQAYGFFTDSRLNARNFFDQLAAAEGRKHPFTRYQAGVNLAAPIARERAHIFASFEHQGIQDLNSVVVEAAPVPALAGAFMGGYFLEVGGAPMSHIARKDNFAWEPLGLGTSSRVFAIEL